MKKSLAGIVLIIIALNCGHKAAPLAKDRLKPSLKKITAVNDRQLLFTFSEVIALGSLTPDQVSITAGTDTLAVLAKYPALSDAEIVFITGPQRAVEYLAAGSVYDTSENKGNFQRKFMGTDRPDTVAPQVKAYRGGKNNRSFGIQFDEAMDTTVLDFLVLPPKRFAAVWTDLRAVGLRPADSTQVLGPDTTYYCWLRRARDISGNPAAALVMSVTPDTSYRPLAIRGRARAAGAALTAGVAVLSRERPVGIGLLREDGSFYFEVRDSLPYLVDIFGASVHGRGEVCAGREDTVTAAADTFDLDRFLR